MKLVNVDFNSKESRILLLSLPVAVIIGTTIATIAFKLLGDSFAFYAILIGAIIASAITYLILISGKS